MTSAYAEPPNGLIIADDVYAPQHDSELLIDAMHQVGKHEGRRVADLCTGSGVVAIAAASAGAGSVTALDISMHAVHCARASSRAAGVDVDVRHGSWSRAAEFGPYDLVLCNPPYVPEPPNGDDEAIPLDAGPALAYDGGTDGRLVLDPLCGAAPNLLSSGGTLLMVHSEFSGVDASLAGLRKAGLKASVFRRQRVPFGPVLMARAQWLERTGRLKPGRRVEELVVIRADMP
jgi:release factor glutamine methyltransferase